MRDSRATESMQAGRRYTFFQTIAWTQRYILVFLVFDSIPVVLYQAFGIEWMALPWQPISLVGIAVAFYLGFKNNASYDRLWEARKIWSGIVNASRSSAVMARDFVSNDEAREKQSAQQLALNTKQVVYRHIAWPLSPSGPRKRPISRYSMLCRVEKRAEKGFVFPVCMTRIDIMRWGQRILSGVALGDFAVGILGAATGCGDVAPAGAACELVVKDDSYTGISSTCYVEPVDPGTYDVLVCGRFLTVDGVALETTSGCLSWDRSVEEGNPGIVCHCESLYTFSDGRTEFQTEGWEQVYILDSR